MTRKKKETSNKNKLNLKEKENQYLKAKSLYYQGKPMMSDEEFDELEENLSKSGSSVIQQVGFTGDRNAKYEHPSPMLSLSKFQCNTQGLPPVKEIQKWMEKIGEKLYEATPKLDGNAVNVIYEKDQSGKFVRLQAILSRGDGKRGRDYTEKLKHLVPLKIQVTADKIEIRSEVVIRLDIFKEKYAENNKNERNFVAGILNRDVTEKRDIEDLLLIPLDIKMHIGGQISWAEPDVYLEKWGFKFDGDPLNRILFMPKDFDKVFINMEQYRKSCPYRLDGFVIKVMAMRSEVRKKLGETSHHPEWATAVKFKPTKAETIVKNITWSYGKGGILSPVAHLEPVYVDGSVISRAALFNYENIKERGIFKDAKVVIQKSGDIIPYISEVIEQGDKNKEWHPTDCPMCGTVLEIEGPHLICENNKCTGLAFNTFVSGMKLLEIGGVSTAIYKKLWNAGIKNCLDIFNPNIFNKEKLITTGEFKEGKILNNMLDNIKKIKEIQLDILIRILGIKGIGETSAKEIAKMITNQEYSFKGLDKSVVSGFEPLGIKRNMLENSILKLQKNGIAVKFSKVDDKNSTAKKIKGSFEMTGSPKSFGWSKKEDFIKYAESLGYVHKKLKDADILITDNLESESGKMKQAKKLGKKVLLYKDLK